MTLPEPARRPRGLALAAAAALALTFAGASAHGHGIWGHIHVTGWAVENAAPGEFRGFFDDPDVKNALLFGAAFTDSGYWPQGGDMHDAQRAYSEHTHWEPFIADFVAWVRANDPPPWTSLDSRKRIAFLLGCAAHGLQDEIFDSLFLYQVQDHDGAGQSEADPGTDGFLSADAHIRFVPEPYVPMDTLLELYAGLGEDVTAEAITAAVDLMTFVYVNPVGAENAASLADSYSAQIPWTEAHYLDPAIPGSLRAEILPTLRYLEAVWERLHGRDIPPGGVVATHPNPPERLLGTAAGDPDSWVTLIYGEGLHRDSLDASWVAVEGPGGEADHAHGDAEPGPHAVPHRVQGTRWGAQFTRLHRLQPDADLEPAAWYEVHVAPGMGRVAGGVTDGSHVFRFQASCASPDAPECPPLDLPVPAMDGSGPPPGLHDAPADADVVEAGGDSDPGPVADEAGSTQPGQGCAAGWPGGGSPPWAWLVLMGAALALTRAHRVAP